jgi:hypothetical protein
VDFSEARDIFVNIFQILRPNCKILGLRVDFGKVEGPKCKMAGNFGWGFVFQRISHGSGPRVVNRAGRAQSTVDQRRRGPRVSEHGGTLTRVRPPAAPVHQSSPVGAQKREEHGEFDSGLTGARAVAWRSGDGGGAKRSRELGGEGSGAGEEKRWAR